MFFSDANNLERYSIFGNRFSKLKYNEIKNSGTKFELIPFLKDHEYDVDWHENVLSTLSDKANKLVYSNVVKRPNQIREQTNNKPISSECDFVLTKIDNEKQSQYEKIQTSPKLVESEVKKEQIVNKATVVSDVAHTSAQKKTHRPDMKQDQRKKTPERFGQDSFQNNFDRRVFHLMRNWYPFKFKLAYPRKSLLNAYEQKEFIEFYNRFKNRPKISQSEVRLYKKYLHYKTQVEKERIEFFDYLKEYYKVATEDYEFMNNSIQQYVNEMISFKNESVNKFDRFYRKIFDFTLGQLDENPHQKSNLQFEKNLLHMGQLHKIVVPAITIDHQPNIIIDYERISKKFPMSKKAKILSKIPLYEDKNIIKLAIKYNCEIAMTNSAFVHLVYHLSFANSDEFKIAIVIKEIPTEGKIFNTQRSGSTLNIFKIGYSRLRNNKDKISCQNDTGFLNGRKHKIILFEKPFIENYLSKREINEKFYKKSLIVTLVKGQTGSLRPRVTKSSPNVEKKSALVKEPERILEKLNVDYNVMSNFESFGIENKEKPAEEMLVEKNQETSSTTKIVIDEEKLKKRNRGSTESVLIASKKMRSNNSSDYEDYGDESDHEDLVIAEVNNESNQKIIKEYQNKQTNDTQIIEEIKATDELEEAPLSPGIATPPPELVPKMIPLNKNIQSEKNQTPTISKQKLEENKKIETTEDKLSLFDLISKLQDKLVEKPVQNNQPQTSHHHTPKSSHHSIENPREYQYFHNANDNLNYSLWKLDSMKILIRSSTVGYVNTEHSSMNPIVIHPKVEYQPQFGCERLTTKDYCKMWAKSFVRNFCDIFLCRINVFTNKLISVSDIKFDQLLPPDLQFNSNQTLNHLRTLVNKFKSLENGAYLLNKDPKNGCMNILKSISGSKGGSFDLHFCFAQFLDNEMKKPSYWMPIDTEIYLPYHFKLNRVPGLFEPQLKEQKFKKVTPQKPKKKRRKGKEKKINEEKQN